MPMAATATVNNGRLPVHVVAVTATMAMTLTVT